MYVTVTSVEGPNFNITKVNRLHMGSYLCIASNHVPPSVSKRIMLIVHCEYTIISFASLYYMSYFFFIGMYWFYKLTFCVWQYTSIRSTRFLKNSKAVELKYFLQLKHSNYFNHFLQFLLKIWNNNWMKRN